MLRSGSSSSKCARRNVLAFPSTYARAVIISLTYNPAPWARHSRRNGAFVTPAIGARTTGTARSSGPMRMGRSRRSGRGDLGRRPADDRLVVDRIGGALGADAHHGRVG